jgi:hypothetical protein
LVAIAHQRLSAAIVTEMLMLRILQAELWPEVVPESLHDEYKQYQEPEDEDVQVVLADKGAYGGCSALEDNVLGFDVVQQHVPERRDGHNPYGDAVRAQCANTIRALEE